MQTQKRWAGDIMKRKLIEQGGGTLMVSLPSKWARDFDLSKGDEVDIEEYGKQIIVSNSKEIRLESVRVDITGLETRVVSWLLSSLHKAGYDEMTLLYDDPKVIKLIQNKINNLFIGFAIVEQTSNKCVIKCISKNLESEFDSTLKRAFFVTQNMAESVYELIKSGDFESAEDIVALEKTNNQLTNFCERILNKKGYKDYKKSHFMYTIIWNLEKVADGYKYICNYLSEMKKAKLSPIIINLTKKVNEYFKSYFDLFYKFDLKTLNQISKTRTALKKEFLNADVQKKEYPLLYYLNSMFSKITDFSASIIAMHQEEMS